MGRRQIWSRNADLAGGSLWFMPAVAVAIALVVGVVLTEVEIEDGTGWGDFLFQGGASEARQLLTVIAGTMITVTGLVFVLTVIALQIASSQFSPRLLKTFLRDRGTQVVLSTFVATFAYSLAGLHTVGRVDSGVIFVPRLAISGALALALASLGMLVYYIHHITDSIRIDTIMRKIEKGTLATLDRLHPAPDDGGPEMIQNIPPEHVVVGAATSGYVQDYYLASLADRARAMDTVVSYIHPIGHHVVKGRPLARVWQGNGAQPPPSDWDTSVNEALSLTVERSIERDVAFGVRQLVDIAIKSVGGSINDPYTSVQAIQHLSVILVTIAGRSLDAEIDRDATVVTPVSSFENYLDLVCSHIRQEAANRPRVMVALLRLLEDVMASTTNPRRRAAIVEQADLVEEDSRRQIGQAADLDELLRVADSLRRNP